MVNVPPNYFNPNAIINMDVLAGKLNSVIWSFDWGLVIGSRLSTQWTLTLTSDSVSAYCLQYVLVNDGPPLTCNDEIGSGGDFRYGVSQMSAGASVKLRQSQVVNNVPAPASLLLFGLVLPLFFNLRRRASTEPFRYRK